MVDVKVPECPQCGAPLQRVGEAWSRRCGFCNADLTVAMPAVRAPYVPSYLAAPRRSGAPVLVLALGLGLVLVLVAVGAGVALMGGDPRPSVGAPSAGSSSPFGGTDDFQWDPGERVVVVTLPGQRREAFVGRVRRSVDGGRSGPAHVHVGLFSGDSFERLWLSPSLGRYSEDGASQAAHFAVAGGRVVLTDAGNTAQVVDLATGRAVARVQLSDRAASVCASAAGGIWIEVADERHVLLDPATGRATVGARPEDCVPTRSGTPYDCGHGNARPRARCVDPRAVAVAGMESRTAVAGPDGTFVALGFRRPGTRVPMVAATGPRGVLWQRPVPRDDALQASEGKPDAFDVAGGGVFVAYRRRDRSVRVVGIDAATGGTLWESGAPRSDGSAPTTLTVGRERVYLPHWTWLDVFDRATGEHLRTVGRW